MLKCKNTGEDPEKSLYVWRNIPRADGFSPAQLLFGRRQFTALPAVSQAYSFYDIEEAQKSRDKIFNSHIPSHDQGTGFLPDLSPGDKVAIQHPKTGDWTQRGVMVSVCSSGQSYKVDCDGKICTRSRKLLCSDPLTCSVSQGVYNVSTVSQRSAVSPLSSPAHRGYVDSSLEGSRRSKWDPHTLSQSPNTMIRYSNNHQGKIPGTVSPYCQPIPGNCRASFGGGITTVLICLVLCLLLCFFIRKNNRANSRARRSELHEILLLTGRGHHFNSRP